MATEPRFWNTDASQNNGASSWFGALSVKRKLLYVLILLFIVSWCFFIGFHAAGVAQAAQAEKNVVYKITGTALNDPSDYYEPVELTGYRTILAIGYDVREGYEVGRSDTIMIAFLNLDDKSVKLLSIPRDSYVNIPGYGKTKINHAFAYGGVTLVKETVEYLLGITIDDYVMIDFKGFEQVVDAVDGVELYVDMDMINWNEGIEIYEGRHNLTGEQALGFCRYRGADCSDYDRIKHQQYFLRSLLDKLMSFSSVTKISTLVNIFMENVTTTIGLKDMLQLAQYAFSMDLDGMEVFTVPGYSMYLQYGGYWLSHEIINKSELTSILNQIAGDDIVFSPNVIDDGGLGSYSIPEGGSEMSDDPMMNGDDETTTPETDGQGETVENGADAIIPPDGGTTPPVDPATQDPQGGETVENGDEQSGGETEGGQSEGGQSEGGQSEGGDVDPWAIPSPDD